MLFTYESAVFDFNFWDKFQRGYALKCIKPYIGPMLGRPYRTEDYLALCYRTFGETPVAVDIGCNIGTTTLPLALRYPGGSFVAVDAHPVALGQFVQNARRNKVGNVKVVCAAVSDRSEPLRMYSAADNSGGNRVSGFKGRPGAALAEEIIVPAMSLAQVLDAAGIERADILKIDTEGYELHVLRSLGDRLQPQNFPLIVAEYGPEGMRSAGNTGWEMVNFMRGRGYVCADLHSGRAITTEGEIPSLPDFSVTDFIFRSR
jgi:FkbM family methyltransferase